MPDIWVLAWLLILFIPFILFIGIIACTWKSRSLLFVKEKQPGKKTLLAFALPVAILLILGAAVIIPALINPWPRYPSITPQDEAITLLKSNINRPSLYNEGREIKLYPQSSAPSPPILNAKAIATKAGVGIDAGQICLSAGDFQNDSDFKLEASETNLILGYSGTTGQKAKLGIICDSAADLKEDLALYNIPESYLGDCNPPDNSQRYCIIMLRYA